MAKLEKATSPLAFVLPEAPVTELVPLGFRGTEVVQLESLKTVRLIDTPDVLTPFPEASSTCTMGCWVKTLPATPL
jgi:hypothetical protein